MQFIDSATWQLIINFNVQQLTQNLHHNQTNRRQVWRMHRRRSLRLDCTPGPAVQCFIFICYCVCVCVCNNRKRRTGCHFHVASDKLLAGGIKNVIQLPLCDTNWFWATGQKDAMPHAACNMPHIRIDNEGTGCDFSSLAAARNVSFRFAAF